LFFASYTDTFLRELFEGQLEIFLATAVLLAWLLFVLPRSLTAQKTDLKIFLGIFIGALFLRCLVPWGPLSFAEAERYPHLWQENFSSTLGYKTMAFWTGGLRVLGIESMQIARWFGPLLGAIAVALTFVLGRALKLSRPNAIIGAIVLMLWPTHLRYSGSLEHAVLGVCLIQALCILMLSPSVPHRWRLSLIASLLVLLVHTKPEFRLAVVPLAFLAWGPIWNWRRRIVLGVLCGVLLLPYLRVLGSGEPPLNEVGYQLERHARLAFTLVSVTPVWWMILGLIGLLIGPFPTLFRAGSWALILIFTLVYSFFGGEHNPLLGLARYQLIMLPFIAVGVGGVAQRLERWRTPRTLWVSFAVVSLGGGVIHYSACTRPVDIQVQFAYLIETGPEMSKAGVPLRVISELEAQDPKATWPEQQILYPVGLSISSVRLAGSDFRAGAPTAPSMAREIRPLAPLLRPDVKPVSEEEAGLVFLGMYRNPGIMKRLTERYELVTLTERRIAAAPVLQYYNTACPVPYADDQGDRLPDCTMTLGWYRLKPKRSGP
jgi:hypothetical protein